MKHEWRKDEKNLYLPKTKPEIIDIPALKFFTIEGQGNPNDDQFPDYIQVLYALSYAVKMSPKKGIAPKGYVDYTVYPLEGIWDITEEAKATFDGTLDKNTLIFKLMIRQPDFTDHPFARMILERTMKAKPHPLLEKVRFETIKEGPCIQMMHLGPYDTEPESFARMEAFAVQHGLTRLSKVHREIYLSDARKTAPEKLKTVLRFKVKRSG